MLFDEKNFLECSKILAKEVELYKEMLKDSNKLDGDELNTLLDEVMVTHQTILSLKEQIGDMLEFIV